MPSGSACCRLCHDPPENRIDPGATPTTRRVVARSCAEAVDAVALIIAVTLGQASPEGDSGEQPIGTPETGASGTTATAATDPKSKTGTADAPKPPPPAGTPDASDPGQPDDTEPPSEPGSAYRLNVEAHLGAEAVVGPAPEAMPGALLYALVALDGDRVFSPGAALGITRALRTGMVTPGGTADFTLDAVTIDLCPLRFGPSFIDVRPCAAALLGRLTVEGRDTLNAPGEIQRPFYVLGGSVLVAGRFGWILEPSLRAALGANLWRDSFAFTPNVFHEVPPLTLSVSLGFGVRVP